MNGIDYIMNLLDWNKPQTDQTKGIDLAKNIKNINIFLQPCNENYNKNVWHNCAKILSDKTDEELYPYLIELLRWLRDLNWPGALCILNRLQEYTDDLSIDRAIDTCLKYAQVLEDDVWESNLRMVRKAE